MVASVRHRLSGLRRRVAASPPRPSPRGPARSWTAAGAPLWPRSPSSSRPAIRCWRSAPTPAAAARSQRRPPTRAASGPGIPLIACCRCGEDQLDAAFGSRRTKHPRGLVLADWGALARRPTAARRFEHVVLVDPPPFERCDDLARAARGARRVGRPRSRLPAPGVERDGDRARRALRRERLGASRGRLRDLARCSPRPARWRARRCAAALAGPSRYPRTPEVAARCARVLCELGLAERTTDRTATGLRVLSSERTELERSRAFAAAAARHEEARRYLRRSTELKDGHTRVGEPSAPAGAPSQRGRRPSRPPSPTPITKTLTADAARPARRPVRGHRGALVRAGRADRPRRGRARVRVRLREPRGPGAQVGRGLHHPPARRGADLRRHAARHRHAQRGAAARHRRGHLGAARPGRASASATRSPSWSTASPS